MTAAAPTPAVPAPADASRPEADAAAIEVVAQRLRALYPGTRIDSVSASRMPGLYEVVMGKNVAYVEANGRYFLFGHVWDMQSRQDLTASRKAALDRVDLAALPRELALRAVHGNGRRVLYVLADPQCGYCKQLEQTLEQMSDVTVYTFVLPILGERSRQLARDVWCSAQPTQAWRDWMTRGVAPAAAGAGTACETPVAAIERLASTMGIRATPTLFAADGRKKGGAMPAAELAAWLDATAAEEATAAMPGNTAPKAQPLPQALPQPLTQALAAQQPQAPGPVTVKSTRSAP